MEVWGCEQCFYFGCEIECFSFFGVEKWMYVYLVVGDKYVFGVVILDGKGEVVVKV